MSLFSVIDNLPDWYFVAIIVSSLIGKYIKQFVNNTVSFQINDARQLPIIIPDKETLQKVHNFASCAISIKKTQPANAETELAKIQEELDKIVYALYGLTN